MTPLLQDKVAAYLADHPHQTVEDIALALRARAQSVREILDVGPFEFGIGANRAKVWRVASRYASAAVGRAGTPGTHKQRVLALLSDGRPHGHMEGYRLGVMLHSRVADLRRDGYDIRCWHEDGQYLYQLVGTLEEAALTRAGGRAVSLSGPVADGLLSDPTPPPGADTGTAQLSLIEAPARGAYDEAAA